MMQSFKKFSESKSFKLLLVILLCSLLFSISGIWDNTSPSNKPIIRVGSIKVSQAEWEKRVNRIVGSYNSQTRDTLLHNNEFLESVLNSLIDEYLLIAEAKKLGIKVSDDMAKLYISTIPAFQTEDGKFDKSKLEATLEAQKMTESEMFNIIKESIATHTLLNLLAHNTIPSTLTRALYSAINSERVVSLYSINPKDVEVPSNTESTKSDIENFFNQNRDKYQLPEARTVQYLVLDIKNLPTQPTIEAGELEKAYEERKESLFTQVHQRKAYVLLLQSPSDLSKIRQNLEKSQNIKEALKEFLATPEPQLLPEDVFENEIRKKIFDTKVNDLTEAIEQNDHYISFYILEDIPMRTLTFDEVKDRFHDFYLAEKKFIALQDLSENIGVQIKNGMDLEKIASTYKTNLQKIRILKDEIDDSKIELSNEFKARAFNTKKDTISTVGNFQDKIFIIKVLDIEESKVPDLSAIHDKVNTDFINTQKINNAILLLNNLKSDLAQGKKINITWPIKSESITLNRGSKAGYKEALLSQIFRLRVKESTEVIENKNQYLFGVVEKVIIPPANKIEEAAKNRVLDNNTIQKDLLLSQYIEYLRSKHKVEINFSIPKGNQ